MYSFYFIFYTLKMEVQKTDFMTRGKNSDRMVKKKK